MPDPVLELGAFSYRYPGADRAALREITLTVEPGEFIVLAGRSASGKSTLLRAGCGLVPHFHGGDAAGDARVCGLPLDRHGPAELGGMVGMVSQEPESQVVSATVRAELELPLEIRGEPAAARARAVEEVALALAIERLLDRSTATLSGGELQRVALAAALVGRPRLILLDEPTSQLDPVAGDELISLLRRLNEEWGTAIVLAEHRLERCLAAADRVLALSDGALEFDGGAPEYLEWALEHDTAIATPLARMFGLAGIRPAPVSVKEARERLEHSSPVPAAAPAPAPEIERKAPTALRVRGLWVELETGAVATDAVRDLSLELTSGEIVALMGRNGAGKSTLLRTIAELVEPARGWLETPAGWALVPQSPGAMFVRDRVGDELPGEEGAEALREVGLEGAIESDPRDLSGGERQRLALALSVAGRETPGLVCLDEPTRGMDSSRKDALGGWLHKLAGAGAAVLVATHDVEFAARLADRVVLLGQGELIADGPAAEILAGGWYFSTEVARALGAPGAITPEQGAEVLRDPVWGRVS